jgi:hypothetical protein
MNSNPQKTLQTTLLTMIVLQTVGTVDSRRRMPAPKQYVAVGVAWGILFLVADLGQGKFAARLSLLMLLPAMILGPFGRRFVVFLEIVARRFAVDSPTSVQPGTSTPGTRPGAFGSPGTQPAPGTSQFPAPISPQTA